MFSDGIRPIGDGLLEVSKERLEGLLVSQDINEIYDVEQTPFARGKFAAVRRAVHKKSGVHFAAKFLRRRRRAQCTLKEIGHEIAILMLCADSKHIVKLNSVHETKSETALLLELATGGELQAILDEEDCLTESQAQICMREILKALQYLHKKYIAHLDLKPQNILLCGDKVEDGLKLCDFGISRIVQEGRKVREILGTPDYVAPEVLQYEPLSLKTDIWSIGVLAYVLLTGRSPFGGDTKQETFLNVSQCALTFPDELFEDVSPLAIDFMKCALRVKPHERMTALECLEHRWLNEDHIPLRLIAPTTVVTINPFVTDCCNDDDCNITVPSIQTTTSNDNDSECDELFGNIESSLSSSSSLLSSASDSDIDCNKENILAKSNAKSIMAQTTITTIATINSSATNNDIFMLDEINRCNHATSSSSSSPVDLTTTSTIMVLSNGNGSVVTQCTTTTTTTNDVGGGGGVSSTKHQMSSLFPDAPTTPKVCRKSSPDSPPSVKALVKKFQLDNNATHQQEQIESDGTDDIIIDSSVNNEEDFCSARCSVNCMPCGPSCRHLNGRKSIGIDQGIIC